MKLASSHKTSGYSLSELLVSLSLSSVILGVAITCGVSLQKSFNATDNYLATHIQQVRIIDYLSRDVKRGLIVTTSVDLQSVTMTLPSYLIQAGDPEALANPSLINTPRTPTVSSGSSGMQVNYGASTTSVVYSINGNSIVRIENGAVTTIASSTDQLVPTTTDVDMVNTEYTNTNVTFKPIFGSTSGTVTVANPNTDPDRLGTTLYATAYLRNKRRG